MRTISSIIFTISLIAFTNSIYAETNLWPSRNPEQVLPYLLKFNEDKKYDDVELILGRPDSDAGSGLYILKYELEDGTFITVGTIDKKEVLYIHRSGPGIKDLIQIYDKTEPRH